MKNHDVRKKRLASIGCVFILSVGILILFIPLLALSLIQEGTPSFAFAAMKMQMSGKKIVDVKGDGKMFLQTGYQSFPIVDLLRNKGWKYETQEGSVIYFHRGGNGLRVKIRMFSSQYQICELRPVSN